MLLDELADVVDRARGLRAAHQEQVLPVARDPVHRRPQTRVVGHLGVGLALGHPRPEDFLADVLDLDRARSCAGRCASADSIAISRLSRYCSSCSKQMYRTLAWPPDATLRAIWRAIVVLPVPWAPPISRSSPVRSPVPIVLSSGVKPSGTGWYSETWPLVTLSFRSTSTSRAERGRRLPLSVSRCQTGALAGVSGALESYRERQ